MEQQKITLNPLPNSQSNLNIADITNTHQKTLRSLHNISSSNIKSKSKLTPGPQFVISYNFQNDPNCQVRTHNLLIGLNDISQSHPKKNTLRKNAILRSNPISNSNSNLRNSRNNSEDFRSKLIHVRSNEILSSQHNKPDSTVHSFYTKKDKQRHQAQQSMTHGNTFWKNERNSFDDTKKNHEKYINGNVTKIANRRSGNKIGGNINGRINSETLGNSLQKISRGKLNRLDHHTGQKENQNFRVQENRVYDLPNSDILERDQSSRLTKRSTKDGQYNEKLQTILRKVQRQKTRQNLKQAYIRQQPTQQLAKLSTHSKSKLSPQTKSIHESSVLRQTIEQTANNLSQQVGQVQVKNTANPKSTDFDPLKNHNLFFKVDPASKSISNHQKSLIEKENHQKPKRKYHHLIKNPHNKKKESLLDQFHRIESQNQNQVGSSKKPSKQQLNDNTLPEKSIDYSINGHLNEINPINGHPKENNSNIKPTQANATPQVKSGVILQKLQFKNSPTKQTPNPSLVQPQKSVQQRYNYHAPTTYQRSHKHQLSHDRQRLNSSINSHNATPNHEKDEIHTKRKVPADYKEFLRLLSQENQRRKEIQEMERQRQLSLNAQKTSRFQNIEQQNQHIKRILAPIGNSFMDQRRKRLSEQRKSKRKQRKQQLKNLDGSIIQSDSESSDDDPKRSYSKKLAKRNKTRKNHTKALSNVESSTHQRPNKFRESLMSSIQKIKKESEPNSPKISKKASKHNDKVQENNSKAKLNQVELSNHEEQPIEQESTESITQKKVERKQNKIQKLTGFKIPQKAIERAKSKRNFRINNDDQTAGNQNRLDKKPTKSRNDLLNQNQKGNQTADKTRNKLSKNVPPSKNSNNKNTQQKSSQQSNQQASTNNKIGKDGKMKPVDKRSAQQKQRKFKNWNQSQKQEKAKKQQGAHNKKDKKANQKDWKEAQNQKAKKDKKGNIKDKESSDEEKQQQVEDQSPGVKKAIKKKAKNIKQTKINENGEAVQVQNTDKEDENQQKEQNEQNDQNEDEQNQNHSSDDENEDQQQNGQEEEDCDNEANENSAEPGIKKKNAKKKKSGKAKQNQSPQKPQKVNQTEESSLKKQSIPSIHQNVQIPQDKDQQNPRQTQNPQKQSEKHQVSIQNPSQKQASIQSKLQSQKNDLSPTQKLNLQGTSNPDIPQKQQANSSHSQEVQKPSTISNEKPQQKRQSAESNHTETLSKQIAEEKKQQMIQNVIDNKQMQQNGFMEITESKFDIYNHQSEKSFAQHSLQQIPQMELQELYKRAEIVKYLYSLPSEYQQEITKFIPNEAEERLVTSGSFTDKNTKIFQSVKIAPLKNALEQLLVFDHLNPKIPQRKSKGQEQPSKNSFLKKLFEPYPNLNNEVGIWMYCVGIWRLITVHHNSAQNNETNLLQSLQKAFQHALEKFYSNIKVNEIKPEEILRMLTGLRISTLAKTKGKADRIFRQIEYNTRKQHIIRAISSSESKFTKDTINCVRKIQSTPTGQKVLQIVSTSMIEIQKKPKFFWIREDKFLQFFTSFTIISRRSSESYWTNESIRIKNQDKAVYMIDSTQKHTSGSITLYPTETNWGQSKQKCTIAFYKEIEPQVLKLVGKAMERLPQTKELVHTSKLYFEFNIKGSYYVFLELDNGVYNVAIQSNCSQTKLDFVEFVKKETNKNEQCEYVEIDKIFKKKPDMSTFQNSNQFKQLMNFMKKTSPEFYQAK